MASRLKRIIFIGLALNILLLPNLALAGQKTIRVITEPPGATIYVDGVKVGKSPCCVCVEVEQGKAHLIRAEKEGYKAGFETISASKIKVFGIAGGLFGVFPFILPFGFAFNKDSPPDEILIRLEPKEEVMEGPSTGSASYTASNSIANRNFSVRVFCVQDTN